MSDLGNLSKWRALEEGTSLEFRGDALQRSRAVRIEVLTTEPTNFFVQKGDQTRLVGSVNGRGCLQFSIDGAFSLFSDGGDASVFSNEMRDGAIVVENPMVYTKIANRRPRNHHLEMIEYEMKRNQAVRMEQLRAETDRRLGDLERRYARRESEVVRGAGAPTGTGVGAPSALPADGTGSGPDEAASGRAGKGSKRDKEPQGEAGAA